MLLLFAYYLLLFIRLLLFDLYSSIKGSWALFLLLFAYYLFDHYYYWICTMHSGQDEPWCYYSLSYINTTCTLYSTILSVVCNVLSKIYSIWTCMLITLPSFSYWYCVYYSMQWSWALLLLLFAWMIYTIIKLYTIGYYIPYTMNYY